MNIPTNDLIPCVREVSYLATMSNREISLEDNVCTSVLPLLSVTHSSVGEINKDLQQYDWSLGAETWMPSAFRVAVIPYLKPGLGNCHRCSSTDTSRNGLPYIPPLLLFPFRAYQHSRLIIIRLSEVVV